MHATPCRGGQAGLETAPVELDATYARERPEVQPGRSVRLAVRDTGCGMDERTKARVSGLREESP
jgi:signal transduction histidine kinase